MPKKKLYVGNREVEAFQVSKKLDLVGILYTDGYNEDFTKAQWEGVRSEKEYPDGEINLRKHGKMISRIIKDMKECRVTIGDHEWILQKISESIGENYRQCLSKVFDVKNPTQIMLAHIDVVLKEKELLKDQNEAKEKTKEKKTKL